MGIREAIDSHKGLAIAASLCVGVMAILWVSRASIGISGASGKPKAFFTSDDGATWFADDAEKLPPFDHNGKPAVMCFVYQTGNGAPWVSHLQRFTAEGLKQASKPRDGNDFGPMGFAAAQRAPLQVKEAKTGDKGWVSISDPRAAAITALKGPDGSTSDISPLDPNR